MCYHFVLYYVSHVDECARCRQLHVFLALIAHMFSYDMRWSTTIKDIEKTTVFKEVPKVLKHFKYTYALMGSFIVGVAIASTKLIPQEWRITNFAVMFPP